ncbi:hypothetical protein BCV70DRAFT_219372 [Testicularia cyperi]|uniref:Beta-hexosaminidase n=1 Tax=Testicularia cyperi TaxID=1882483 RepID=A0A317XGW5_9BASI|nr:hypothetical protein BCV70DRAFT_219372 [Testicularia cyperi]
MTASLAQLDLAKDTQPPADIAGLDAEMYTLDVPADGSPIKIKAYTALGAYRALQTLAQLVYSVGPDTPASGKWGRGKHAVGDGPLYIQSVPISIQDRPAYGYRGLLLDTSRNWYPLSVMLKLIDGMAVVKMNQLHWHATDTQSWPLAFDKDEDLSRLALNGSYGWTRDETGQPVYAVYTESDVSEVINYGAAHGVNVILEVDMPSHLMSGVVSLDNGNLITCAARDDWQNAGAQPPTGQLNLLPTKDAKGVPDDIGRFVTKVLDKIAGLSQSPYVSSGGDEPNLKCWGVEKEADIDASIIKPFMELVTKVTSSHSKLGMVWEEMGAKFPETAKTLAPGSIVEVWNNATNAQKVLANNAEVNIVLAPYQSFYLDCGGASSLGNNLNPNWCPYVGWQNQYAFDPESVADSVVAQLGATNDHDKAQLKSRFIGGESAIWSEQIDETNLETKVWPRAAAGAEVFWTGSQYTLNSQMVKRSAPPSRSDSDTAPLARILDLRYRMRSLGFNPEPLQPKWCALRPGKCNLQK